AAETEKTPGRWRHSRFALIFGKRRLNLYFSSGKAIDGCDKIVSEYTLGQRGLFALPIRVVKETVVPCRTQETKADSADLAARLMNRLLSGMEGQVLEHSFAASERDGLLVVTLRAHCMENIALARTDGP
ncbi:MAG: sporulation protein YqfD, partial [Oscillospiraceae bacterium]|nr:sporulation protein YqfD [Oscillospiraceae bacterium]